MTETGKEILGGCGPFDSATVRAPGSGMTVIYIILTCFLLFFLGLGAPPPGRNAEERALDAAQSIYDGKAGLIPIVAGEPYVKKPPLYAWMSAGTAWLQGNVNCFAIRFPAAVGGLLSVIVTFLIGKILRNARAGLIAAIVLATTYRFNFSSHLAMVDIPMTAAVLGVLLGFLWLRFDQHWGIVLIALGTWAATFLKGHVGWIWILVVLLTERISFGAGPKKRAWRTTFGILIGLLGSVWWFIYAVKAFPSAEGAFFTEIAMRFGEEVRHEKPFWYYPSKVLSEMFPWSLFFPLVGYIFWSSRKALLSDLKLYFLWFVVGMFVFSLSSAKQSHYLLPIYPAFALAFGTVISTKPAPHTTTDNLVRFALYGIAVFLGIVGIALNLYSYFYLDFSFGFGVSLTILLFVGGYVIFCLTFRRFYRRAVIAVAVVMTLVVPIFYSRILPAKLEVSRIKESSLGELSRERRLRATTRIDRILHPLGGDGNSP